MASLSLGDLLKWLKDAAEDVFKHRNDPARWDASIEQAGVPKRNATLESVSLEATAFEVKVKDGDKTYHVKATPHPGNYQVLVDEGHGFQLDPDARLIYKPAGSLGNPFRFHLDFKRVTVDGEDYRFNLAYPKG